jgi:hypothetical protein
VQVDLMSIGEFARRSRLSALRSAAAVVRKQHSSPLVVTEDR